jgi:3-dehydroquinate dehydratase
MIEITYFQSNIEELIDKIQELGFTDGIILNAGAYTHTSIAMVLLKRLRLLLLKYIFRTLIRVKVSDINLTFQEMQRSYPRVWITKL